MEEAMQFYRPGVERMIAARENQGEVTSNKGLIISRYLVENWRKLVVSVRFPPRIIYLSVDSGGGSVGHMGVAAHVEQIDMVRGIVQLVVRIFYSAFCRFVRPPCFGRPRLIGAIGGGSSLVSNNLGSYCSWNVSKAGILRRSHEVFNVSTMRGMADSTAIVHSTFRESAQHR